MALPTIKDLVLYVNKKLTGNDWNTNWQKIINWLTNGEMEITVKTINVSKGGAINNSGNLIQNGNLTVNGNLEAENIKANTFEGDGSKLYNLITQGIQAFTPFSVNSGNTNNGNGDLISAIPITEGGVIPRFTVKFKVGTVDGAEYSNIRATTAKGDTFELEQLNSDELAANGTFYYFVARGQTAVTRLSNITIYRQPIQPANTINDVWLDTSQENLVCKKCNDAGIWEQWDFVPLGKVVIADINTSSATATVETFAFNQNGYNVNLKTNIFGITAYAINSLIDKSDNFF